MTKHVSQDMHDILITIRARKLENDKIHSISDMINDASETAPVILCGFKSAGSRPSIRKRQRTAALHDAAAYSMRLETPKVLECGSPLPLSNGWRRATLLIVPCYSNSKR